MKTSCCTHVVLGIIVALCNSRMLIAEPTIDGGTLRMSFAPERPKVLTGAPCIIQITLANENSIPIELDMTHDGPFWFVMLNTQKDTVCVSSRIVSEGTTRTGIALLQPGDSINHRVILNHWCTTNRPPGEYTLMAHYTSLDGSEGLSSTTIEVLEANEPALKKLHLQLADSAVNTRSLQTKIYAAEELLSTDSPYAVEALGRLLRGTLWGPNSEALETLKRIGTPEALQEIAAAASLPGDRYEWIRPRAVQILRATFDSTENSAIRAICQPFVERQGDKD